MVLPQATKPFVHLHVHSQYSLLDGACRIGDLISRARELEQPAIAITDHGCLFGVAEFYSRAVEAGIKPILGMEAYIAPGSRHDRTATGVKDGGYHLLLLAQNHAGYRNLLKLASIAYTEGFYYKPRIDKEILGTHSEGLICTSACLGGQIPAALLADNRPKAREIAEFYLGQFGPDRFFIELQKHIPEQDRVNGELMDLADRLGVGCVATNDVHFLLEGDHEPHDVLCCISTGKLITDESRMRYPPQLYLKSTSQMYAAMDHPKWVEACANTYAIAQSCDVQLEFGVNHAPVVKISRIAAPDRDPGAAIPTAPTAAEPRYPVGSTEWYEHFCAQFKLQPFDATRDNAPPDVLKQQCDDALRQLAEAGLVWRYGRVAGGAGQITDEHRDRLDRELRILADKNISAYFLVVWDFVNEARRRSIPASARGSGVGTMVGYVLGLSNACPIRYGLLFERFTDPDRSEYPDIDIDICQDGRQPMIDYVRKKYGHVAQIITFGTLKARAAIRDVGRVLNVPLGEVDRVCKLIGNGLSTTIDRALGQEPELRKLYADSGQHRRMIDTAKRLEGLARHAGVHAAGVVIATGPLENIVPLYKPPGGGGKGAEQLVTQWDGPTVDKVGLLKMDFLGLRTLSVIDKARQIVRETMDEQTIRKTVARPVGPDRPSGEPTGQPANTSSSTAAGPAQSDPLDLDRLTYDDPRVFDLFSRGETAGVFQFESGGMRNLLMAMKPDRIEDLIAANALYRPGPMDLIPDYNDRKHGRRPVPKVHPIVDQFTAETYGVMVYQEQVMLIVHELGGIGLGAAYTLIKAISKKSVKVIDAYRDQFIAGAGDRGLSSQQAVELFDLILKFAGYGFNKSHSTGYAIVAYQTAYLKTYFPKPYMAALLTYESASLDKVVEYVEQCKRVLLPDGRRGIDVKPPDINRSDIGFSVVEPRSGDGTAPPEVNQGHIRFGLSAVKGVGEKAIRAILDERDKDPRRRAFSSLYDFCERVAPGTVNRATIEALIKCGAFDELHGMGNRAAMVEALDSAILAGHRTADDRDSGQMNFFGTFAKTEPREGSGPAINPPVALPKVEPWARDQTLDYEKQVLGFYLSSHPLDEHRQLLDRFSTCNLAEAKQLAAEVPVVVGGILTRVRLTVTRAKQERMAMLTIEDKTDSMDAVAFPSIYIVASPLLEKDRIVFLKGKVDRRREEPSIVVDQVVPMEQAAEVLTQTVKVVIRDQTEPGCGSAFNTVFVRLREVVAEAAIRCNSSRGGATVVLELHQAGKVVSLNLNGLRVRVDQRLSRDINEVLNPRPGGQARCKLLGPSKITFRGASVLNPDLAVRADVAAEDGDARREKVAAALS